MEPKFHYSVPKSLPLVLVPSHINPVHTISSLSYKPHFNITLSPWMWSLSTPEPYMQVSPPQHKPHPSSSPQSEDPNNIWWLVQIMKLLIMQFSPASCHFPLLQHKHLPQQTILEISLPMVTSLNLRNQVSHPYKTTRKTDFHMLQPLSYYITEIQMILYQMASDTP